jgi:hypothetical protein
VTRWANSGNATAAALKSLAGLVLCDLHFDSGIVYVHDAFGPVTNPANSQIYSGLGEFGGVNVAAEDLSNVANPVTLTLSGVDPAYIADVMTENCQGRVVTLWIGLLDINAMTWFANPEIVWEGRMDVPSIAFGDKTATITMTCEHRLMREPVVARYTDQDQKLAHSTDNFFDLLWMIPLATASWGKVDIFHPANQSPTPSGAGGRGGGGGGGHPGSGNQK